MKLRSIATILFSAGVAFAQGSAPLIVPQGTAAVPDGSCLDYGDGVAENFTDAGGFTGTVHLKHDGASLWVCVEAALGTDALRNGTLYLDPQGDGGATPATDDASLEVRIEDGLATSRRGEGAPGSGYVPRPGLDLFWRGSATIGRAGESIEFQVSISGLQVGTCGDELRVAFGHHGVALPNDDYFWPAGADPASPDSWRRAVLADPPCSCGGTFPAIADAEVRESDPDGAYGGDLEFVVARDHGEQRALLAFDVTAGIPRRATVDRAVLELPMQDVGAGGFYTLEAGRLDDAWDESSVTWNNQPTNGPTYAAKSGDQAAGVLALDVTTLVRGWTTRGIGEQSLVLATPTDGAILIFDSREAGGPNGEPRITIRCSPEDRDIAIDKAARDAAQELDLDRLILESLDPVTIELEDEGGGVRHATFTIPVPLGTAADGATRAQWFLSDYRDLMRTSDPATEWQLVRRFDDDRHLHFRQRHQGIPVFPSSLAVWMDAGHVTGISGRYVPDITRDPDPRLPAVQAELIAAAEKSAGPSGLTGLVYLNRGLLGEQDRTTYLAWAVHFPDETLYVDADSGAVLERITHVHDTETRIRNAAGSGPELVVAPCIYLAQVVDPYELWFDELGAVSGNADAEGWTAWNAIRDVDSYWHSVFNRDSYDGSGSPIWMYIHVGTQQSWTAKGYGWPNALAWTVCNMFEYSDSAPQLDVVGHEFTHAVTRYTAGLAYKNQSGALNESYSDVFGQRVDDGNWTMGEGMIGGPLRDLSNPPAYGQPSLMQFYDSTSTDNGGVHTNSGIPNKAFHLATEGGTHFGYQVTGIGAKKTEKLWGHVLWGHLGSGSQFIDARNSFVAAAEEFVKGKKLSFSSANACSVKNAWAAVELGIGDIDCDGIPDSTDPDDDGDGVPDQKDNCPQVWNGSQQDTDGDSSGNACDSDDDNDQVTDPIDNCPLTPNKDQADHYGGPEGDACDDTDADGVTDLIDNCPLTPNPDQGNADSDADGNACDADADNDSFVNAVDNCWLDYNPNQDDGDTDGVGDACDLCPGLGDPDNTDTDGDGMGNPCDDDDDDDNVLDDVDNCPLVKNPGQVDWDQNGIGIACDEAEQDAFSQAAIGGLVVPVNFDQDLGPVFLPLPVGPSDGPVDLPGGLVTNVQLDLPIQYYAHVLASDGATWTMGGPNLGTTNLSFKPPAFGATLYPSSAGDSTGTFDSSLLVPPPDQLRFSLVISAAETVDPFQTFDLFVRYDEQVPPLHVSHVAADSCGDPLGAPPDGAVSPGEDAILAVGLGLEGSTAASAVSAVLETTTPGVTITRPEAQFPDIPGPGGARSLDPHFAFSIDRSVACGTPIDFSLNVQTATTRFVRHFSLATGGDVFAESSDTPLPIGDLDTVLSSIDIGAQGTLGDVDVTVWVTHGNVGELELTLVDPTGNRVPLARQRGAGPDFAGTTFDDAADRDIAAGQAPFPARFRPEAPLDALAGVPVAGSWQLEVRDGVRGAAGQFDRWSLRIGILDPLCAACTAPSPGDPDGLSWTSKTELQWNAVPDAGWYNLYEGVGADLPKLLDGQLDSCLRRQGTATSSGPVLVEDPAPGALVWYVVRAASAAGEGPAGYASAGPRVQDSTGECP